MNVANQLFSLDGRIALITGASRGLGRAMAEGLAESGATVVLNGRSADTLEPVADRNGHAVLKRNGEPYTKMVIQLKPIDKLTPQHRCLIESITYTKSGKPNLKLISKEYCHRELRKMLGGDAPHIRADPTSGNRSQRQDNHLRHA